MSLERLLSEKLTIEMTSGTPENVELRFIDYINYIKANINTYNKRLFKLNVSNYAEYIIQNHGRQWK